MKKNVYLIILTLVTVICIIGGTCYHLVGWGVSFLSHLPFASFYSDSDDTESSGTTLSTGTVLLPSFNTVKIDSKVMNLSIEKGEFCVLLGPSGSGKSTLLNIIGGIDRADSGQIIIEDELMEKMNAKRLSQYRRKHLGYVFQMYNLIPNLTVRENIEVGAYLSDHALDVDELLDTLGLSAHQKKLPNQLSGGQQQRTAIGRAIVKNPDILLCDEPTGALDYKTSKEILKLIETVNQKYGNTVVMVTHNDAIKDMADHVVRIRDGMIRKNYLNDHKVSAQELDW